MILNDTILANMGILSGLLKAGSNVQAGAQDSKSYSINNQWFEQPTAELQAAYFSPSSYGTFVALIETLMDEPKADPATGDKCWYAIPDLSGVPGNLIGMYLVTEAKNNTLILALGIQPSIKSGDLTFNPYLRIPLFAFTSKGGEFVYGEGGHPLRAGIKISGSSPWINYNSASYKSVAIDISFDENQKTPETSVYFDDAQTPATPSYPAMQSLINDNLLNNETVNSFLTQNISASLNQTYQVLLSNIGVITGSAGAWKLADQSTLSAISLEAAWHACVKTIGLDKSEKVPIADWGNGLGAWGVSVTDSGTTRYGFRVYLTGIKLPLPDVPLVNGKQPKFGKLQIGEDLGAMEDGNWTKSTKDPGLTLYTIEVDSDKPEASPAIDVISVGLDYGSNTSDLLISINEFGFVSAGFRVAYTNDGGKNEEFAPAVKFKKLTIPVANVVEEKKASVPDDLITGGVDEDPELRDGDNDGDGGDTEEKKKDTAEKTKTVFGISGSHALGTNKPDIVLYDSGGTRTTAPIWFDIGEKTYKKVSLQKIGASYDDKEMELGIHFQGKVSLGPLNFTLLDLEAAFTVGQPPTPTASLRGMEIDYSEPKLQSTLSGGLYKSVDEATGANNWVGELIFQMNTTGITLLGSYAEATDKATGETYDSLFIFAAINYPLICTPQFFLQGVCVGMGYNMKLEMPAIGDVAEFPLVLGAASDTNPFNDGKESPLEVLAESLKIDKGEYFVTAGIIFTTYKMIQGTALAVVQWGNDLEVDVIGLANLRIPLQEEDPQVNMTLQLEAVYSQKEGSFRFQGQLTDKSYIINPACKVGGGFAVAFWFTPSDKEVTDHSGDWVVALGGYGPYFQAPSHYPTVP
ncbi:MAG: DUF6603 domain-containing protein, partial [Bacteroidota bacterium]